MNWGSIAELVAAACTIVTVVVSVAVAIQQIGERRKTEELLQQERNRARRADADAVSAWIQTVTDQGGSQRSTLHVLNSSPRPIFAVTIIPMTFWKHQRSQRIICAVLGPGVDMTEDFTEEARGMIEFEGGSEDVAQRIGVKLIFRDAAGLSWERGVDGRISERTWNFADDEFPPEPDYGPSTSEGHR